MQVRFASVFADDTVRCLLGANPSAVRARGRGDLLPLHLAVRSGAAPKLIKQLLRHGPEAATELASSGETSFDIALRSHAPPETVLLLLEHDLPIKDDGTQRVPHRHSWTKLLLPSSLGSRSVAAAAVGGLGRAPNAQPFVRLGPYNAKNILSTTFFRLPDLSPIRTEYFTERIKERE